MSDSNSYNHENVVSLKPEGGKRTPDAALARLPAAMHQVREKTRLTLQTNLRTLFDKADDALFELADRATNNHEQNLYFDSMRQVRLCRKEVEAEFFRQLDTSFARLIDPAAFPPAQEQDAETSLDNLSLVGKDELEELVASETMVNRANEQFAERVQHLTLRMDQLVPVKVYQKNNPVGCDAICQAFIEASGRIEIDVKARLVVFKLFDKHLMRQLGELYDGLNQQLIEANILPSLNTPRRERRRAQSPASQPTGQTQEQAPANTELNSNQNLDQSPDQSPEQLLNTLRGLLNSSQTQTSNNQTAPSNHGTKGLSSQDLMSVLTLAQQRSSQTSTTETQDVKTLVNQLLERGGAGERKINQVDEDVINLVSMMFEFILEDRSLASPMKALLARLQIPMIKVAVADKSFFGKGGHPARRLLNEMATSALGWQDVGEEKRSKDALYNKVDQTVQRILADYSKDISVFDTLLIEFRAFREKEKRRAKLLEQRTIDAEDGKAKSQRARAEVDAALEEITAGVELPQAAAELLATAWSNVLFITCLKEGPESQTFTTQLKTAENLVWSATTTMTGENRQQLLKLVPQLLGQLRKGLEGIAFNPYQMDKLFKALKNLHIEKLRAPAAPEQTPQTQTATSAQPTEPTPPANTSAAASETNTRNTAAEETEQPAAPAVEPAPTQSAAAAEKNAATNATANRQETAQTEAIVDEQHLSLVSNLRQGSWFEMSAESGDKYRCRLAAIIKPTGKYIFVNRTGMKVAEESREELALALKTGRLRILDDGMLFDRALESVIGNLRQSRGGRR